MTFDEWIKEEEKKKKQRSSMSFDDWINAEYGTDIAPVGTITYNGSSSLVKPFSVTKEEEEEKDGLGERIFDAVANFSPALKVGKTIVDFAKGGYIKGSELFSDGYDAFDITKTILGTARDAAEDTWAGIVGTGEQLLDAGMMIAPYFAQGQYYQNGGAYQPLAVQQANQQAFDAMKKGSEEFVKKDLYDEQAVAKMITSAQPLGIAMDLWGINTEEASVLDKKTDAIFQSAGQLGVQMGANAILPGSGMALMGVSAFGSESENALNNGANMEEAILSGAISAGAEVLTEKISGGIKFGGKTLDDALTKKIARSFSNGITRNLVKVGADFAGEGLEEVVSDYASRFGQWLTYRNEEDLTELLWSEEARQERIDAFFAGGILGGVSGSVNAIASAVNGGDAVTGFSKNEQKVFDKVYKDKLAEAEKNGKLTNKEKSKIYDDVIESMERGYISTDTIEEVLGGDSYKAYTDYTSKVDSINKEYEELKNKKGEATLEEQARFREVRREYYRNQATSEKQSKDLKNKLHNDVFNLVKNDRLAESYNERARIGAKFQYDPNTFKGVKHEDAAKKTLENAIKARANNTNKVHDMVDMLARSSGDTGLVYDFASAEDIKNTFIERQTKEIAKFEALENRTAEQEEHLAEMKELLEKVKSGEVIVDGDITGNGIVLNIDSDKPWNRVFGHEVTHSLEQAKAYKELKEAVFNYAKTKGIDVAKLYRTKKAQYAGVKDANPEAELVADLVGDYLFTDSGFIRNLAVENRTVFEKIWEDIKHFCKIATAGSQEKKDFERLKKAFEDAYREASEASVVKADTEAEVDTEAEAEAEEFSDAKTEYSIRTKEPPKNVIEGYKVFVVKDGKLYPPMVANPEGEGTPVGVWLDADVGGLAYDQDGNVQLNDRGRFKVKAGGKGTQGGGGELAFRPGWHLGEYPDASQFGRDNAEHMVVNKKGKLVPARELFPYDFVWARCEVAADHDYQLDAMSFGVNENGNFERSQAGLPYIPEDGYYKYRTNADPNTAPWIISGSIKVVEILDDNEVAKICAEHGVTPQQRQAYKTDTKEDYPNATTMKAELKEAGVAIPKGAKAADLKKLYSQTFLNGETPTKTSYSPDARPGGQIDLSMFGLNAGQVTPTSEDVLNQIRQTESVATDRKAETLGLLKTLPGYAKRQINFDDANIIKEFGMNNQNVDQYRAMAEESGHSYLTDDKIYGGDFAPTQYSLSQTGGIDNGQNPWYNAKRGDEYVRTDEFRNLQAECQRMSDEDIQLYHSGSKQIDEQLRANLARVLRTQIDTYRNGLRNDDGVLSLTNKGNEFNMCRSVDGSLFHDVFEIAQKHLRNGELVDLHTVETTDDGIGYNDCNNYLSEDGLSGFSITPDGDLISVFNASGKGGFLGAIAPVVKENAKTLDCYNSPNQPLRNMYEKVFGFKTASIMDYNMEYDHDNIAVNHNYPQVAFMVNSESDVELREFTKDEYDEALAYRNSFVDQAANNEAASFVPENANTKYSLSDSKGRALSPAVQNRFANSKAVDEDGNLKALYHGTASGEFFVFDKSKGSVEGDFGSGFYFTDNEYDVERNYEGGGPDFENKIDRLAEQIEAEEDISYAEARKRAIKELYKGSHKFEVYLNIENPAIVGKTMLLDPDSYFGQYNEEDYDSYEDYEGDVEQLLVDDVDNILWEIDRNVDVYNTDGIAEVLYNAFNEGGIGIEDLKHQINNLYLEDSNGNMVGNEVTRQIIESLGYDGIIDPTVSGKWNMDMEEGTTHYIVFKPNQIKSVTNENPTDDPDIRHSLSNKGDEIAPVGNYDFYGKDFGVRSTEEMDVAPVAETVSEAETVGEDNVPVNDDEDHPSVTDKRTEVESVVGDKDSFMSKQAMELYNEITNLKKGVRASKRLGYLLDHGHEWRSIKTALLNIKDNPNQVVNPNSAAEAVAREMLGREYDAMVEDFANAQGVTGKIFTKMQNLTTELENNRRLRDQSSADFDSEIARLQAEYEAKQNKNTKVANDILRRIERIQRMKANVDADYGKRIENLEARIEKMSQPGYKTAMQRKAKQKEYSSLMEKLVGDTSTWKDKKLGISYKVNTLRRNLRDIVRDANGNKNIEKADAIYDELQGKYNHNEAELKRESMRIKEVFQKLKLNHTEDTYAHMLGEFRHNPDSKLAEEDVKEFYEKHKKQIDTKKVDTAIEESRKVFDELIVRVNERLREQGMKEIPYRQGYFPHFTNPKQGWLAKLLNWKPVDTEIPTSIAGITETFNPERSWQGFSKQRKGDTTDYSLEQGLDTYIHGALDWIYHIEDIQKRRALENHIRYIHSEEGVKAKVDAIRNSDVYDADEMQEQIDLVYKEANNPLNNFVTDLRAGTNTLANKKSSMDRAIEEKTNRKIYSVMTNLNNRINANMVVGSFSSALTNFIPITQSWVEVSPVYSLKGMRDTIISTIRDDGVVNKSDFLTNRLMNEENLYQTGWDKVSNKVGIMMEAIDSFTSQTVWRSKYLQNISEGMSETEAIKNADQFAENVIAGRSRGNQPTIFDAKNPFTKIFTAFQLEVANQYGYMFKDAPQDSKNEIRLVKGYATAFMGAYVYNALYSSLTGRDAALDPMGILEDLFKDLLDDDEEPEDTFLNLVDNVLEEVPFVGGLIGGGRIPISSVMPYSGEYEGLTGFVKDVSEGDWEKVTKEMLTPLYYLLPPVGGGQLKKSLGGLSMFSDEHPIAGSYTDSGNLRYPVEDNFWNRTQAILFGQYANENARDYFDNERSPLKEKQIQEFIDVDIPIRDYWEYREGLAEQKTIEDKFDYIAGLDLPVSKKNILINNVVDREEDVDLTGYEDFSSYEEFDFATKNPGKYAVSQAVGGYTFYSSFMDAVGDMKADKDQYGNSISGSKKEKVVQHIESLNIDYGMKIILYRSMYDSKSDRNAYNAEIVEYLNNREDISYEDMVTILTELGMTVSGNNVYWD